MAEYERGERLSALVDRMRDLENRMQFVCSCSDALWEISAYVDAVKKLSTNAAINSLASLIEERIDGSIDPLLYLVNHEALVANANAAKAAKAAKAEGLTTDNDA